MHNHITKQQQDFLDWEFGVFFHFGIRTFYEGHKDWDMKPMDASAFNPTNLDCEQWIRTIKKAGAKYAIFVCKHHDGFANWPSKYTDYSVANTPWKNGKGDVVDEFVKACRKYDIKVGLYYSPAQVGASSHNTEKIDGDAYCTYFINQISELLTNYGKIDYLWFDGCGSEGIEYDKNRIVDAIRSMQPDIMIFNMWDPDTRWVGNESGYTPLPNYNYVDKLNFSILSNKLDEATLGGNKPFLPAECDFKMRQNAWFHSKYNEYTRKSLDELLGIYYYSVGRGSNFLINIGPDEGGVLPQADCDLLLAFGDEIRRRFSNPVEPDKVEYLESEIHVHFKDREVINTVVMMENLETADVIDDYSIGIYTHYREQLIDVYYGKTVGHKAICEFPHVSANEFVIKVNKPAINITDIKFYNTK